MAINFPDSPSINDTYTYNGKTYEWNGSAWQRSAVTETGNTEGNTGEVAYYSGKGSTIAGATAFFYDGDKVGIGTSGPTETLDVRGGITASGGLSVAGATFANDINVNNLTIGKGGGDVASNTAVGYQALNANTEGHSNVASGMYALNANTEGDFNVASGYMSLFSNTEGSSNVAVGYQALYDNTEGEGNVASGMRALYDNTEGNYNVASGSYALRSNTEGDYNVASGFYALRNNIDGDYNSALGYNAGSNGTTGSNNTYIGYNAQPSFATASNEIVLGDSNVTLIHSVAGMSMGGAATFGDTVIITGVGDANLRLIADTDDSGETDVPLIHMSSDGSNHSANIGLVGAAGTYFTGSLADAMFFEGQGAKDIQFANNNEVKYTIHSDGMNHFHSGISADAGATFGGDVVFQGGISADAGATFGGDVTAIGGLSVAGATFSNDITVNDLTVGKGGSDKLSNTAVGYKALYNNTTGNSNVASGFDALKSNTEGWYNVASGYRALYSNTEGDRNVASGVWALFSNTGGNYNVASGTQSLYFNTEGNSNVASGWSALYNNTEGDANVASGTSALYSNTEGDYNIATGMYALFLNTEGDNNVATGTRALYSNTIGDNNSALGYYAGYNATTGSNNTYIGHNAQPSSNTVNNEIVLGDSNVTLIHSVAGMSMGGGATFGGAVNLVDNELSRPKLKDYSETALATTTKSASFTVDFEDGNVQSFTIDEDATIDFENWPASGVAGTVTLIITGGDNDQTITWDTPVKWPGDNAPALSDDGVDIVSFMTIDAGTTIYGFVGGINFS